MRQDATIDFADIAPAMTGEDFGFLLQKFPGTMVWLASVIPATRCTAVR